MNYKNGIQNIINFNNGYSTIVCENLPNIENIKKLNIKLETDFKSSYTPTYSNVDNHLLSRDHSTASG